MAPIPCWRSPSRRSQQAYRFRRWRSSARRQRSSTTIRFTPVRRRGGCWFRSIIPSRRRCLVSGTGLTHLGSAENRAAMHGRSESDLTDSMRMFRLGLEAAGRVRTAGAPHLSGFTRAAAPCCAHTASRWSCRDTRRTAAKRPRSRACTSSIRRAARAASAWPPATSFPITSSRNTTT